MKYWNINEILPFQRNFNFINGERSIGKTYTTIKYVINKCLLNNLEFVYICRTQSEKDDGILKNALAKVLDNEFKKYNFVISNETIKNETNIIGRCIALSESVKIKKHSFPNVKYIIFDEYMLEQYQSSSYVNGWKEPDLFLSIYHTIDREEDRVICFLLGNNLNFYNPYHLHSAFKIPMIEKGGLWTSENVLFQYAESTSELKEEKSKSKFVKMISDSNYGKMASNGEYIYNNEGFIEKLKGKCNYLFTLKYDGIYYGVWVSTLSCNFIISMKFQKTSKITFALSIADRDETTQFGRDSYFFKTLLDKLKKGYVRFENMTVKTIIEPKLLESI